MYKLKDAENLRWMLSIRSIRKEVLSVRTPQRAIEFEDGSDMQSISVLDVASKSLEEELRDRCLSMISSDYN